MTMAQPAQANPFAAPSGDPMQQQTMQGDNPFGSSFGGQPAPQQQPQINDPFSSSGGVLQQPPSFFGNAMPPQQQVQTSDPFSAAPTHQQQQQQPMMNGSLPSPPQQQPSFQFQTQSVTQQQVSPPQSSDPFSSAQMQQPPMMNGSTGASPPQQQQSFQGFPPQQQAPPSQQTPFDHPQQVAPQSSMQQQQFTQQQFPPAPPPFQQPVDPFSTSLVPAAQPANPYAQSVAPPAGNPFGGQAIVQAPPQQQHSQWAVPSGTAPAVAAANPFDPFAPPPPPAPAPAPPPAPPLQYQQPPSNEMVPAANTQQQGHYQAPDFPFDADQLVPAQNEQKVPDSSASVGPPVREVNAVHGGHSVVSEPETTVTRRSDDRGGGEMVPYSPPSPNPQNKYSQQLARNAPPGCAPLPKGELVVKSGYILSRISFRTILMKKWKQTYWVQYGRHTMLWFRSENHFNEWLSNPYLSQAQRNFLVKLAINFVHDLYKPNVRGYQVTQAHSKPYGRKIIRQFKLERWMDYGPTIAAAFGSPDSQEVDVLRQTIIDCMRNTPLENGIRATGAVRQDGEHEHHGVAEPQRFTYDEEPRRGQCKYYQGVLVVCLAVSLLHSVPLTPPHQFEF